MTLTSEPPIVIPAGAERRAGTQRRSDERLRPSPGSRVVSYATDRNCDPAPLTPGMTASGGVRL